MTELSVLCVQYDLFADQTSTQQLLSSDPVKANLPPEVFCAIDAITCPLH